MQSNKKRLSIKMIILSRYLYMSKTINVLPESDGIFLL